MICQFAKANLSYTGTLVWNKPLSIAGPKFLILPYVSGEASRDGEAGGLTKVTANTGVDAKKILSTSMNLDETANPDFLKVAIDRQWTNFDRFVLEFFIRSALMRST
jgi:hypothetical protein